MSEPSAPESDGVGRDTGRKGRLERWLESPVRWQELLGNWALSCVVVLLGDALGALVLGGKLLAHGPVEVVVDALVVALAAMGGRWLRRRRNRRADTG